MPATARPADLGGNVSVSTAKGDLPFLAGTTFFVLFPVTFAAVWWVCGSNARSSVVSFTRIGRPVTGRESSVTTAAAVDALRVTALSLSFLPPLPAVRARLDLVGAKSEDDVDMFEATLSRRADMLPRRDMLPLLQL